MNKNKIWFIVVISVLLGLNVFLIFRLNQCNKRQYYFANNSNTVINNLHSVRYYEFKYAGSMINDIQFYSDNGLQLNRQDVFKKDKYYLHISEKNCQECVEDEIRNLSHGYNSVDTSKISVLAEYKDTTELAGFIKKYNFKIPVYYHSKKLFNTLDTINDYPMYFSVDNDYKIKNVYIPAPKDTTVTVNFIKSQLVKP